MSTRLDHWAWKTLASLFAGWLIALSAREMYTDFPGFGDWLGRFTPRWAAGFTGILLGLLVLFIAALVAIWKPARLETLARRVVSARQRSGWLRWIFLASAVLVPPYAYFHTDWGDYLDASAVRLLILLLMGALTGILSRGDDRLLSPENLVVGILLCAFAHLAFNHLVDVVDYPFALSWSEGNRLYDYSVQTNPGIYHLSEGSSIAARESLGRYLLWGAPFLIPGTPIWLHRLWDGLLWAIPGLMLGWAIASWRKENPSMRLAFALWAAVFLAQGPIYPPLVLSALLVAALTPRWPWISLAGVALAGYYAALSRWTWLPSAAVWGALIVLSRQSFPAKETLIQTLARFVPALFTGILGIGAGLLANPKLVSPEKLSKSTVMAQPLLWDRLLPNSTYTDGLLIGLALAALPVCILLIWLWVSKRWQMAGITALAGGAASLLFMGMGLVASVKIGGGNNLHNLDMFLVTLLFLAGLAFRQLSRDQWLSWPAWATAVLVVVILYPAWFTVRDGRPIHPPAEAEVQRTLEQLKRRSADAQADGPVLLIDQRQLITFGYLDDIRLVTEYEKKYMMDKAMAGDADYFKNFYEDLRSARFAMIISDPIYAHNLQEAENSFSQENNAWVQWVARPLLCFYEIDKTFREVRVQTLTPKAVPSCEP